MQKSLGWSHGYDFGDHNPYMVLPIRRNIILFFLLNEINELPSIRIGGCAPSTFENEKLSFSTWGEMSFVFFLGGGVFLCKILWRPRFTKAF